MKRALRIGVLVVLTCYPLAVVAVAAGHGVGVSQDSASYLAAADSLSQGLGALGFTGEPLTIFPPGLPALLAVGGAMGMESQTAALALNLLSLAVVVLGTYFWGRVALGGSWAPLCAAGIVSLSTAFVSVFGWLWSEPPFTALVVLLLLLLTWAVRAKSASWPVIVGAAVLVALATSLRYVGVTLIPVVALAVWLASAGGGRRVAARRSVIAIVIALIGPAAIAWRNVDAGAGPFGDRVPGSRTMEGAFGGLVEVLGGFLLPSDSSQLGPVVGAVCLALLIVGIWLAWVSRDRVLAVPSVFVIVYTAIMVWSQATTRLDAPSARLLAPALPAMAILGVFAGRIIAFTAIRQVTSWAAASTSERVRTNARRVGVATTGSILTVAATVLVAASLSSAYRLATTGADGSLVARAESSDLVSSLTATAAPGGVASNDPWTLYVALGRTPILPLPPAASEWPSEVVERDASALVRAVREGTVSYAAVFSDAGRIEPLDRLSAQGITVEKVGDASDGVVYRLTATP